MDGAFCFNLFDLSRALLFVYTSTLARGSITPRPHATRIRSRAREISGVQCVGRFLAGYGDTPHDLRWTSNICAGRSHAHPAHCFHHQGKPHFRYLLRWLFPGGRRHFRHDIGGPARRIANLDEAELCNSWNCSLQSMDNAGMNQFDLTTNNLDAYGRMTEQPFQITGHTPRGLCWPTASSRRCTVPAFPITCSR